MGNGADIGEEVGWMGRNSGCLLTGPHNVWMIFFTFPHHLYFGYRREWGDGKKCHRECNQVGETQDRPVCAPALDG